MGKTKNITNEVSFISELHEGKGAALQQLFDIYYRPLCNYACRIIEDKFLSEDIVSASFNKIWRRRIHFDNLNSLVAYLYTVTKNASLDQVAILKRRKAVHRQIAYLSDQKEDIIHNKMIRGEVLRSILAETEMLPPRLKEVFGLIYLDGLSVPHAAAKLGLSPNTVKTQHSVALKKLRVVLQKKYSGTTRNVEECDKYEEPSFEYRVGGILVPDGHEAKRRKMAVSKKGLLVWEDFIDKRRILLISELPY